jgi:hypothetical protein
MTAVIFMIGGALKRMSVRAVFVTAPEAAEGNGGTQIIGHCIGHRSDRSRTAINESVVARGTASRRRRRDRLPDDDQPRKKAGRAPRDGADECLPLLEVARVSGPCPRAKLTASRWRWLE